VSDDRTRSMTLHPASGRPRKRTLFRMNWAAVGTVAVASSVAFVLGMGAQFQVTQLAEKNSFESVGWCTDAIADAGGICHGEPVPPCAEEDSTNCYWDAASRGNGVGRSFVDIDGEVYYQEVTP
jgi:hypothetical protein